MKSHKPECNKSWKFINRIRFLIPNLICKNAAYKRNSASFSHRKTQKRDVKIGQKIVLFIEAGFQIEYLIALAWNSSFECISPVLIGQIRPLSVVLKSIISHLMTNSAFRIRLVIFSWIDRRSTKMQVQKFWRYWN